MIDKSLIRALAMLLILGVLTTRHASAQITTGTVSGSIRDAQSAIVPGATVTLVSTTRGTTTETVTSGDGNFVFPNVTAGAYTLRVSMDGFKTLERPGILVSPGDRVLVPTLTIDVGALSETVTVASEAPVLQGSTGERSFTINTESVANLPLADRNFATLASLAPGVSGTSRIGGGGATNFMMDGVGTMDTGSNRLLVAVNVESIAEVKVLTSGYQAEYGPFERTADHGRDEKRHQPVSRIGLRRGAELGLELEQQGQQAQRRSKDDFQAAGVGLLDRRTDREAWWQQQAVLLLRARVSAADRRKQRDTAPDADRARAQWRFFADDRQQRQSVQPDSRRVDRSAVHDHRYARVFPGWRRTGRIPASRLYQPGLNVLRMYPMPNTTAVPGAAYNFEIVRPNESLLAYQPAARVDYQPFQKLRTSVKYTGWQQRKQTVNGSIPGFNDTRMQNPVVGTWAVTANYNLNPTTFLEGTWGRSSNEQAGCALTGGGPNFCTGALPMNPISNRIEAGLGNLPFLFPEANVLNPNYYAYGVMNDVQPPIWDGVRLQMQPGFTWAGRVNNSPPSMPFPGFLNVNRTWDVSISLTKVMGRHTVKTGFYNTHSYKAQQRAGWNGTISFQNDVNNPLDATYPYANAALGIFTSYNQASKYVEGVFLYNNTEGYIQDNWKVNNRLTLDYGVRLVHQQPQYDSLGQASNFLPETWNLANAPLLYAAMCPNNVNPCAAASRQARNPLTGQSLGPNSSLAIGTLVAGSGDATNGLFLSGQGIVDTTYTWPALAVAPRFGAAYDLTGQQRIVLRGGAGLFFDRPDGNAIFPQVQNPPTYKNVTVRYGQLQALGSAGLTTEGPPALAVYEYDSKLPASWQWNTGVQLLLPWSVALDTSYVGQHSYDTLQGVNLNTVDYGAAFLPQNQDLTLAASTTPGATAVSQDQMRAFRGYGSITQQWGRGWRTYHSLQLSFQRRFSDGFSFGFNDTITFYDRSAINPRLQHSPDGSYLTRDDQAQAQELLGNNNTALHIMKANFVWDLPDVTSRNSAWRAIGLVVNDWMFSGIWSGARAEPGNTGSAYTVGYSYQNGGGNVNLTGSPDFGGRIRVVGDTGSGCSSDPYRQFNTAAFQGPLVGSVGLESGNGYLTNCFINVFDVSIARNIRLGGSRQLQLRVDLFNAPNTAAITGRNTTINLTNPNDPVTATNLPFDAAGNLIPSRSLPRGAGFGVANDYQDPRRVQVQVRLSF